MSNTPVDIEYLVNEIESIMSKHSPIEAMYNDIFHDIEVDIPLRPRTEQWENMLKEYHMNYDDFICNVLMAVLSDICSDVSEKKKVSYLHTSDKAVRQRQKKIVATKEKVYGEDLYNKQPYFKNVKKLNLSNFYLKEFLLVLHEEIAQSDSKKNPLFKLTNSDNINLEHFSYKDLENIIKYYKSICKYITNIKNDIPIFQRMIILYHLEMEIRFATIFQMLKKLHDDNLNDIQEEILYQTREICSRNSVNLATNEQCHYQNIIYFGKSYYIEALAKCCQSNKTEMLYSPMNILNPMYEIVKWIYVIRDTIMDRLRKTQVKDYSDFINNTFITIQSIFDMNQDKLSHYEQLLLQESENIVREYDNFNSYDIKVEHFVRMYISDDKFDKFQQSEKQRKYIKAEKRKTKNKKSYS